MKERSPTAVPTRTPLSPVQPHRGWLLPVILRRLPDRSLAEDVLQEVSLAALNADALPEDETERKRWLCRVAITQCALFARRMQRSAGLTNALRVTPPLAEGEPDPLLVVLATESRDGVRDCLDRLPEECRAALLAKYVDGRTYVEMAEAWNVTPDAAEYRVVKARGLLRRALVDSGFGPESDSHSHTAPDPEGDS